MASVPTARDSSANKVTFVQLIRVTSLQRTRYKRKIEAVPMWRANTSDSLRWCEHSRVLLVYSLTLLCMLSAHTGIYL